MRLVLIQEDAGFGRMFHDNRYLCFTREWGQVLEPGEYIVTSEFNTKLNQELPKVAGDNELWLYPAIRKGNPPEGIELGVRRNSQGLANGNTAVDRIMVLVERYLAGENEVVLVVS